MKLFGWLIKKEKKKQVNFNDTDVDRLKHKNDIYKAAIESLNYNPIASFFGGSKIQGSLNYPSATNFGISELRRRSRAAIYDSPQAAAIVNRLSENIINSGLTLESTPMWNIVKPDATPEERKKWTRTVEQNWKLYSLSKEVSYDGKYNFQQLQKIYYRNKYRDGEQFAILRYTTSIDRLNPLSIQFIESENIQNPDNEAFKTAANKGNKIIDGIEFDKKGAEVAYYVYNTMTTKIVKVPKFGSRSKRLFVIHTTNSDYPNQSRGIPDLSGVLHELQKITDYSLLELQAAVINAVFAVWIEPSDDKDSSRPFSGIKLKEEFQTPSEDSMVNNMPTKGQFNQGGLMVQNLKAGEKAHSFDTKRPNVNFDQFTSAIMQNLSSSLSIPYEVLTMTFGQNYSASRASLMLFWNKVIMERSDIEADFLNPIFEMWFLGEVEAGRIKADRINSKLIKQAWLHKRWIGIARISIDPFKEAKAVTERLAEGLSTREIESQNYNGTSYEDNIGKLKEENDLLAEANKELISVEKGPVEPVPPTNDDTE